MKNLQGLRSCIGDSLSSISSELCLQKPSQCQVTANDSDYHYLRRLVLV